MSCLLLKLVRLIAFSGSSNQILSPSATTLVYSLAMGSSPTRLCIFTVYPFLGESGSPKSVWKACFFSKISAGVDSEGTSAALRSDCQFLKPVAALASRLLGVKFFEGARFFEGT